MIQLSSKSGLPLVVKEAEDENEDANGSGSEASEDDKDRENGGVVLVVPPRQRGETPEEKKARKQLVKDARKVRSVVYLF